MPQRSNIVWNKLFGNLAPSAEPMKNLTEGNPVKLILTFALPAFASTLANVLYNLADTVIVGNTVNSDALAGVGLAGTVTTRVRIYKRTYGGLLR